MTTGTKFATAIDLTQEFIEQLQANQLSPDQITDFVANLVATTEGARGFFVGYLTGDLEIADRPTPSIIKGLAANPQIIADLLVKNLAMSTAQELYFRRQEQPEMAEKSATVARRSRQLMTMLGLPLIQEICQQLTHSIQNNSGIYVEFLERWGYDSEQRQAIQEQLAPFSNP